MPDQYFVLRDDVGITADGNLEPLIAKSLTFAVPAMRGGQVIDEAHAITIVPAETLNENDAARIIPGTRIIHSQDPRVSAALAQEGIFQECDPPTKKAQAEQRKEARAAEQEAGTHKGEPDTTNPDNPVNDKGEPVEPPKEA